LVGGKKLAFSTKNQHGSGWSHPPLIDHGSIHSGQKPDFSSTYPDAAEDINRKLSDPLGLELDVTAMWIQILVMIT
jgi:hypothetical protein